MQALISRNSVSPKDIAMGFASNIFVAISRFKETRPGLGIRPSQLFTENVPRWAHSFSADALVNLVDHSRRAASYGNYYLLTASGPGLRALALVHRIVAKMEA